MTTQIRNGDKNHGGLEGGEQSWGQYKVVWDCAEQGNSSRWQSNTKRLLFYFISDSMALRRNAVGHYGNATMLASTEGVEVAHTSRNSGDEEQLKAALRTAAGQMWLFGFTDCQVTPHMTAASGPHVSNVAVSRDVMCLCSMLFCIQRA